MKRVLFVAILFAALPCQADVRSKLDALVTSLESVVQAVKDLRDEFPAPEPIPEPIPPAELALTHLGTVRLPQYGTVIIGGVPNPVYARGRQQFSLAAGTTDEIWATCQDEARGVVRTLGRLKLPQTIGESGGDPTKAPLATWLVPPVQIGQEFENQVVAAGQPPGWARLMGVYDPGEGQPLLLNYAQYYHVTSNSYRNLSTISRDLDPATEVFRDRPAGEPPSRSLGGWLAKCPWVDADLFLRSNSWENGNDGGPRSSSFSLSDPTRKSEWVTNYSVDNRVDATWSTYDNWHGWAFLEAPTGERYWIVAVTKGTAPGWYGGPDYADGPNGTKLPVPPPNTNDLCSNAKGRHAHPYFAELWLFRHEDVMASTRPVPCRKINLDPLFGSCARMNGLFIIGDTLWIGRDQVVKYGLEYANNLQAFRIGWE